MNDTERRLADALAARAGQVTVDVLRPLAPPTGQVRPPGLWTRERLAIIGAVAATLCLLLLLPLALRHDDAAPPAAPPSPPAQPSRPATPNRPPSTAAPRPATPASPAPSVPAAPTARSAPTDLPGPPAASRTAPAAPPRAVAPTPTP